PAAAAGSRDLLAALVGMLAAVCPWRGEKPVERFVEDRAVGFVFDQRRRQRLVHPRARQPNGRDRVHRIDRFRHRDSDAGGSQRGDEADELIAKPGHLTTPPIHRVRGASAEAFDSTLARSSSCLSSTPSAVRTASVSSSRTPRRTSACAQSSVSAIDGGLRSPSLRIALTKRAASAASFASSSGTLSSIIFRSCSV